MPQHQLEQGQGQGQGGDSILESALSNGDEEIRRLRLENRRLDEALRLTRLDLAQAKSDNESLLAPMRELQHLTLPFLKLLKAIHGEIEMAPGISQPSSPTSFPSSVGSDPRWASFKQTFPGTPAEIIDALSIHGEMTTTQLQTLLKAHYNTIDRAVQALMKAGAITKDGGRGGKFRLKL